MDKFTQFKQKVDDENDYELENGNKVWRNKEIEIMINLLLFIGMELKNDIKKVWNISHLQPKRKRNRHEKSKNSH